MQILGLGNFLTKLLDFLVYVTEDIFFTFFKIIASGFAHVVMDTLRYVSDFVLHIIRLAKR